MLEIFKPLCLCVCWSRTSSDTGKKTFFFCQSGKMMRKFKNMKVCSLVILVICDV